MIDALDQQNQQGNSPSSQEEKLEPSPLPSRVADIPENRLLLKGSTDESYKVNLEIFEGPLDLLLYLIKKEEVDIYDVSIEAITKEYLHYLETFEMLNIEIAGEFIVMAATLLYIKSRTLLPQNQQMPLEETEDDDPRWELIRQLIEYKKFKDAALHLQNREEEEAKIFPRIPPSNKMTKAPEQETLLLKELSIFDLIHAFSKAIEQRKLQADFEDIYEETYTVADRIEALSALFNAHDAVMTFEEIVSKAATRSQLVVTFLAVLELIRMKYLRAEQQDHCTTILIKRFPAP